MLWCTFFSSLNSTGRIRQIQIGARALGAISSGREKPRVLSVREGQAAYLGRVHLDVVHSLDACTLTSILAYQIRRLRDSQKRTQTRNQAMIVRSNQLIT